MQYASKPEFLRSVDRPETAGLQLQAVCSGIKLDKEGEGYTSTE
jgi:hypothetical protein